MITHTGRLGAKVLALSLAITALAAGPAGAGDSRHAEISFVVRTLKETNVEGPDVERSYFPAGSKRIVFGVPANCRMIADGNGVVIVSADSAVDGEIRVSHSAFTPELDLAENALQYREAAARTMPREATGIEVQRPVMNPYPFNGWKSLGFAWTYAASGRPMVRTVSYINLEIGVQIVVTTLASKADAEKIDKIAKQFMGSWWVMESATQH